MRSSRSGRAPMRSSQDPLEVAVRADRDHVLDLLVLVLQQSVARSAPSASRVTRASTSPASWTETALAPSSSSRRIAVAARR